LKLSTVLIRDKHPLDSDDGGLRTARPTDTGHASIQREVGRLVLKPPPSVAWLAPSLPIFLTFRLGVREEEKADISMPHLALSVR
jgi:hypothetical protein